MHFTQSLAELSTCKRAQVGCVIIPKDFSEVYAIGYNGPPAGTPNDACTEEEGACGCVHAEANALLKLYTRDMDCRMLCTTAPCERCAGLIINKMQITRVIYNTTYRTSVGMLILQRAGIRTYTEEDIRHGMLPARWSDR